MKPIVIGLAFVLIVGCLTLLRPYAEAEVQDGRVQNGKLAYDKYCTPCHGVDGAPGSAVFASTKKPVDLRTYVHRNGGRFPTGKWWDVVFSSQPSGVHGKAWERIHNDPTATAEFERDIAARGVAANIEFYVMSIQTNGN